MRGMRRLLRLVLLVEACSGGGDRSLLTPFLGLPDLPEGTLGMMYIVFSRRRSGSTSLCDNLQMHPLVDAYFEVLNPTQYPTALARELEPSFPNHKAVIANLSGFVQSFQSRCTRARACGFKVFDEHVPADKLSLLVNSSEKKVKMIVLERENITAETDSLREALLNGNFGGTPCQQKRWSSWGYDAPSEVAAAAKLNDSVVAAKQRAWFDAVRALSTFGPQMWLKTEDFVASRERMSAAMEGITAFLGLPLCNATPGCTSLLADPCSKPPITQYEPAPSPSPPPLAKSHYS